MREKLPTACLIMAGTFVSALVSASFKGPSEMLALGVWNALWGPILQSLLMFLTSLGYQSPAGQRLLRRPRSRP